MLRSLIAGVGVAVMAGSGALAQSCTGNPVAVQVLGSGAPGFVKDRANTSYLLWIGNQAKILVDAGGGAYVRFGQAQAKFSDLAMILVSHLHPDHSSDLPGVLWSVSGAGSIFLLGEVYPLLGQPEHNGWVYYVKTMSWALGIVPALAAVAGGALLVIKRRREAWVFGVLIILFWLYMGSQHRFYVRWMLPLYPALAILAGLIIGLILGS